MDCCVSCEKLIEEFVGLEGHDKWRSAINDVHAELILSRNCRGYRKDKKSGKQVLTYKLFTTEADIYNYTYNKNSYFWNENIFQKHIERNTIFYEYGDNISHHYCYHVEPALTSYHENSKISQNLTMWRRSRMIQLGVNGIWKNCYNF